jgi:hypothetical protein
MSGVQVKKAQAVVVSCLVLGINLVWGRAVDDLFTLLTGGRIKPLIFKLSVLYSMMR